MTLDATQEHPLFRDRHGHLRMAQRPAAITPEMHRAALERLLEMTSDASTAGEHLRGLQTLFKATFCDQLCGNDMRIELIKAAHTVADCMEMLADRLDRIEERARARFDDELAKVA